MWTEFAINSSCDWPEGDQNSAPDHHEIWGSSGCVGVGPTSAAREKAGWGSVLDLMKRSFCYFYGRCILKPWLRSATGWVVRVCVNSVCGANIVDFHICVLWLKLLLTVTECEFDVEIQFHKYSEVVTNQTKHCSQCIETLFILIYIEFPFSDTVL